MPAKRKAIETTPDPSPTPKRRATRSGALAEVQALTSGGSSTGLNGGYWDSPSKRQPRISTAEDKEGSLKENDADTDGDPNEPSDDEDPLLLSPSKSQASPSKRHPVRKYGRPTRKEIEQSASVPRGRAKVVPRVWQSRQASVNTSTSRHLSPATVPPSTLASEDEDDALPVIAPTPRRAPSAKSRSPTKRTRASSPVAGTASSTTSQRGRRRASPPLTDVDDTEDGMPSPPPSPVVQAKVLPLARASSSKKSGASKKLTPPVEPLPPLTPFSLPKKQTTTAEELGGDALPTIAKTPAASPRKQTATSPVRLTRALPMRFQPCLAAQKNAVLRALRTPPALLHENASEEEEPVTNEIAYDQLKSLLSATMERGEGNSCMLVGPRGSGKTHVSLGCCPHISILFTLFTRWSSTSSPR
jgi:origin recognition complex subunit 4